MVRVCVKLTNQPKEMVFTLIKLVHFVVFDCVFFFFFNSWETKETSNWGEPLEVHTCNVNAVHNFHMDFAENDCLT